MLLRRHSALLLFFAVLSLCGLGIVMLYSATAFSPAAQQSGDSEVFLKSQACWLALGLAACGVMAMVDYRFWGAYIWWIVALAVLLLALCYVPGIGMEIKGARRWIGKGGLSFQPSEFAKVAILLFLAWWYDRHWAEARTFVKGFLIPASVVGVMLVLILFESDVGTTVLLSLVCGIIWMIVGIRKRYLLAGVLLGLVGASAIVARDPGRLLRVKAFTVQVADKLADDPSFHAWLMKKLALREADLADMDKGANFQQEQSVIAIGSGGLEGVGPGQSRQKNQFLPDAHTDFIFAIVGEELGLRATLAVVFSFVIFVVTGGYIAARAPDAFGLVLGIGIVSLIGIQVFINMGVVTAILPNKGIALPFISKGGSSLLACLAMTGLLVSIARQSDGTEEQVFVLRPKPAT